jgi:hypothetical protein
MLADYFRRYRLILPFTGSVGTVYDIADFFPAADHGSILITSPIQS